jgi:hypothetical protein
MEKCLVLSARKYDFKDEAGKQVEGVTITYLVPDVQLDGDTRGCQPLSTSAPSSLWPQIERLPAVYEMDFKQRPGPKGKPTLQLVAARFVEPFELFSDALPQPS